MGFPPSGSGRLVNGVNLQPAARREIERKIFGPVPESEEKYIKEYRDRLTVTFDTTAIDEDGGAYWESDSDDDFHPKDIIPVNLNTTAVRMPPPPAAPVVDLNWFDFNILFNSRTLPLTQYRNSDGDKVHMRKTLKSNLAEQYIAMICGHANNIRHAVLPDDQRFDSNGDKIVSCKWLSSQDFEAIRSEFSRSTGNRATVLFNIKRSLESMNVTRENFQTLDYLFIPVLQVADDHYILFGLAPKQRRLFVVNSFLFGKFHSDTQYYRDTMLALLRYLVPREDRDIWDMDVDMVRSGEASANAEINKAVMQRDAYNCGIYVCTNALCLAFGYDLKCYTAREIDQFRKQRMIAEMRNGGFNGLYNYDVFELPQGPGENSSELTYRDLLAEHRRRNGERLPEGLDDSPKGSEGSSSATESIEDTEDSADSDETVPETDESDEVQSLSTELVTESDMGSQGSDGGGDDDEARGLENIDIDAANLFTKKMVPRPIFPTASQCLWIEKEVGVPRPESIERPVDPQYDARYGFLYPFYHVDFDEAVKCSKEEMIEACKNFPVANWERWCDFDKDFFLDWMMTEMGATMSRIHKDPTPPCPGLGDGYNIWLKWKKEGKKPKLLQETALETSKEVKQDNEAPKSQNTDNIPALIQTSPRKAKLKDEKKMVSPTRKSPRLLNPKIRLVENPLEEEQVVTEVVSVMSAMTERPRKRPRTQKSKSPEI